MATNGDFHLAIDKAPAISFQLLQGVCPVRSLQREAGGAAVVVAVAGPSDFHEPIVERGNVGARLWCQEQPSAGYRLQIGNMGSELGRSSESHIPAAARR